MRGWKPVRWVLGLGLLLSLVGPLRGQAGAGSGGRLGNQSGGFGTAASAIAGSLPGAAAGPSAVAVTRTVSGHVVNALTGTPVPRALVSLNARSVLTDAQGRFSFVGFSDANGFAQVQKPGYAASATSEARQMQRVVDLDAYLELKLYPHAIITGLVSGPDGLPLARTQVRLRQLSYDIGGARWFQSGQTQTDVHGEYRFDTSAGRYRVVTGYAPRSVERGEAVLPVAFPPLSSAEAFEVSSGEQRRVDLRPRVGPSYPVRVQVDGANSDRGVRLTASGPAGSSFQLYAQRTEDEYTTQLPAGTFSLKAVSGDRDGTLSGDTRVVVTGRGTAEGAIHLIAQPVFPVETSFDFAPIANGSAAPATPSVQQFNLQLRNLENEGEGFEQDARLMVKPDHSASFSAAPGRYRLTGGQSGGWYVRSASVGATDLLSDELVVAGGAAGSTIRLVIANTTGRLKGTVTTAGQPAIGWVYLVPQQPALVPYFDINVQTDGSFQWTVPAGHYVAVPSGEQVHDDFRDAAFLRKFLSTGRAVEVTAGTDSSTELTLAAAGVAR